MTLTAGSPSALISPRLPLWQRLIYAVKLRIMKAFVTFAVGIISLSSLRHSATDPTLKKVYQSHKSLTHRVFVPKSYKSGDALLPLYLDIHGGGFALGSPQIDDRFCSDFANDNKVLVVSLDYPKAPSHPFPSAVRALTDAVNEILEDESLPINKKEGKIGGLISFYGPLDFTIKTKEKMATRPAEAGSDPLEGVAPMFNWGYVNAGQDLRDPLLSVAFAPKAKLPPKIYLIGCELDLLCKESEAMAERLVNEGTKEPIQSSDIWEKDGVKWEKILGEDHAFDAVPTFGQKKIRVEKRREEMFESAANFLFREVYH